MKFTTLPPELTDGQQRLLEKFLNEALRDTGFLARYPGELVSKIQIWIDGRPQNLIAGSWEINMGGNLYLAQDPGGTGVSKGQRLSILLALITRLKKPSPALGHLAEEALSRHLLEERREIAPKSLILANEEVTGLAFNEDKVASLVGGHWILPSGEGVDVTDPAWMVCAEKL